MPLLSGIKNFLFARAVKKYPGTNLSTAPVDHFEKIRSIGIVFDAMDAGDRDIVNAYEARLRENGKEVSVLGYFNAKLDVRSFKIDYFDLRDLSFAGIPTGEKVQSFIREPFDVLINLDLSGHKPVDYLCAASQAIFKVGPAHGNHAHYDLLIDIRDRNLTHYLELMRTTFNKING